MPKLTLVRTDAENGLTDAFARVRTRLPGAGTVASRREAAFRRFENAGLPSRRVEEWKYTDLRALMRDAKPLAEPPAVANVEAARTAGAVLAGVEARRIVIVDGTVVPTLSDLTPEPGLEIGTLARALAEGDLEVVGLLGAQGPTEKDVAFALNTALMGDGVVIRVAKGATIARPIHLVFCFTRAEAASVVTRSLVTVGAGARATLLESHEGPDGLDYQVNHAVGFEVADDAVVEHVKVGLEGDAALHLATLTSTLGRAVTFRTLSYTRGGAVVRNQSFVRCDGERTHLALDGVTLSREHQHTDATLVVDHAVGHCTSRETFKSVLDGESRAVFQGKIVVRPDAQKTDGKMASHALLLSEVAEANHKPELEIFADDVVCGHGATAGALDDELKFYLMARGIPKKEAETLLIRSFVGEVIDGVTHEGVREALENATVQWLDARA